MNRHDLNAYIATCGSANKLYTIREAAEVFPFSISALKQHVTKGTIKAHTTKRKCTLKPWYPINTYRGSELRKIKTVMQYTSSMKRMVLQEYNQLPIARSKHRDGTVTALCKKHDISTKTLGTWLGQARNGGWDSAMAVAFSRRGSIGIKGNL